jgi:thiol-disulfide isomerase/thioredoxin
MSTGPDVDAEADPEAAAEARFDFLLEEGVFLEEEDGTVSVGEGYDAERAVYHDTYGDASDEVFHETLSDLFGLAPEEAAERAKKLGVERADLVAYLALRGYFKRQSDADPSHDELLAMAGLVTGVTPTSPVPDAMPELDDETYRAFVDDQRNSVVFVWRLHCQPCDVMKADLGAILEVLTEDIAVAGVDGESVVEFRKEFGVDAAPAVLTFADGELVDCVTGAKSPDDVAELAATAFGEA